MMNDMNRGMYSTPNKRFPDQYPNQGKLKQGCCYQPLRAPAGVVVVFGFALGLLSIYWITKSLKIGHINIFLSFLFFHFFFSFVK